MSFILDALKKAESERHRASGPVLVDVRIAPPRRRMPAWVWVLGGILLANLTVLGWLMLRKPAAPVMAVASVAPGVPATPAATPPAAASPAAAATIPAPAPAVMELEPAPATSPDPLVLQSAPFVELPSVAAAGAPPPAATPVTAGLRTAQEVRAAGVSLPPLVLNLHSWDVTPVQRYVLLNGLRLTEGEFTPDGIKVEAITEDGVVLHARGQRFLLPRGG